jgi:hypothetical protein
VKSSVLDRIVIANKSYQKVLIIILGIPIPFMFLGFPALTIVCFCAIHALYTRWLFELGVITNNKIDEKNNFDLGLFRVALIALEIYPFIMYYLSEFSSKEMNMLLIPIILTLGFLGFAFYIILIRILHYSIHKKEPSIFDGYGYIWTFAIPPLAIILWQKPLYTELHKGD